MNGSRGVEHDGLKVLFTGTFGEMGFVWMGRGGCRRRG